MVDFYLNYEIGPKSDVWALGCFLYYICFFELPFDDNKLAIVNAKFKPINTHLTMYQPFSPIIRGVFKIDPDQRPTTTQILHLLESIASDKNVDPNTRPFESFRSRQVLSDPTAAPPSDSPASKTRRLTSPGPPLVNIIDSLHALRALRSQILLLGKSGLRPLHPPRNIGLEPALKSPPGLVFNSFSLSRTWEALLDTTTKPGQILCLNGIRVLSINWVVLGHLYLIGLGAADYTNALPIWQRWPGPPLVNIIVPHYSLHALRALRSQILLLGKSGLRPLHPPRNIGLEPALQLSQKWFVLPLSTL
eukprot:sb/3467208/